MNASLLNRLLAESLALPAGSLPDSSLLSLSRLHAPVYAMVVINGLDAVHVNRVELLGRIEALHGECLARCSGSLDLERRARLVPALFWRVHGLALPALPVDGENACLGLAASVARGFLEGRARFSASLSPARYSVLEHGALCCMLELVSSLVELDEGDQAFLDYLEGRFSAWAREMNDKGCWPGISCLEALRRVDLLDQASSFLLGPSGDDVVRRAFSWYAARLFPGRSLPETPSMQTLESLWLLREVSLRSGLLAGEGELARGISSTLEGFSSRFPAWSAGWLYCLSHVVDDFCAGVTGEMQREMLLNLENTARDTSTCEPTGMSRG